MPTVWRRDGLRYTKASDEHGWIEGGPLPALGEKLELVPGHCEPGPSSPSQHWYGGVPGR